MNVITKKKACVKNGFSLVELLIYVSIFAVSAVFLVAILTTVTQVQLRQVSIEEVSSQISFVNDTIQRIVKTSSLIDMTSGSPTSTLSLRMSSSSVDQTLVYTSSSILYLDERNNGVPTLTPLTDSNVTVDSFIVTKYDNPNGFSLVQVDISMSYNSTNPKAQITRSLKTAVSRMSAAEFDSSVYPNTNNSFDLGTASKNWKDAYFAGNVGIGVTSFGSGYKLVASGGDVATKDAGYGFVAKTPDGTACYRIGVTNAGAVTSTSVTCP